MANVPLIANLTKGARAALPLITALVETALNPTSIIEQVRSAGFSFRTQIGFDLIAQLRDNQSTAQYLRSLTEDAIPNPQKFGTAVTNILRNYSYRVLIRGRDAEGNTVNREVTLSSNDVLSKSQILEQVSNRLPTFNPGSDIDEVDSMEVTDALQSPSLG